MGIHRTRTPLSGEMTVAPDREMAAQALVLALLVRGRTVLEDFVPIPATLQLAEALTRMGLAYEIREGSWYLEGQGFQYSTPDYWECPLDEYGTLQVLTLLAKDTQTAFSWKSPDSAHQKMLRTLLNDYFRIEEMPSSDSLLQWRFQAATPAIRLSAGGDIPYRLRNRMLLGSLVNDCAWRCEEKVQIRDQFSRMMAYFGVPVVLEATGLEEMDELARRMARAQGLKVERKFITSLQTVKVLTAREYFVPGDPTVAASYALDATLAGAAGDTIQIRNVALNAGRSGFFAALKRLGANLDITSRRERYGDLFGNLSVAPAKKLTGRRLAPDVLATCMEEIPFLAVAACFADGETILRVPSHLAAPCHDQLEKLAENLKKTGAEVGLYDEGLVLRGRDECDASAFDCHQDPILGLALLVLARHTSGISTLEGIECIDVNFPGITERLLAGTEV